jgi:hypothetical protein
MDELETANESYSEYQGVRGWLALLLIGMLYTSYSLVRAIINDFDGGQYAKLYGNHWLVPTFLVWDSVYLVLFGFGSYLVIRGRKLARRLIIHSFWTFALINVILVNAQMIDARNAVTAGTITQVAADSWTKSVGSDAGRAILVSFIWIPYLRKSKRVKATFIN